jgi:tetratricopeptide (TPR) repeat protein
MSTVTALLAIPIGYPAARMASGEVAKLNNFDAEPLKQGKVAKALAELQRASSLDPTGVFTSRHLGLSDELTAQVDEAFAMDRRALARKPHEPVMPSFPTVLRDKTGRYDEVLAIFEQAASIDPLSRTIQ